MLQFIVLYVKNMDIIYCLNESSQYLLPIPLPPQRIWRLDVRSGFLICDHIATLTVIDILTV